MFSIDFETNLANRKSITSLILATQTTNECYQIYLCNQLLMSVIPCSSGLIE